MRAVDPTDGLKSEAWIACEDADAPDFLSAYNRSRPRLVRTVDALSIVTQCAFSLATASFSVYRLTDNPEHVVYFRHLRARHQVGITLWKPEQLRDIAALTAMENPGAMHYFREAINASTPSAQLAMLVITAEALAGQGTVTGTCKTCGTEYSYGGTNRDELAAVLGPEAYNRLYKSNNGSLRNRLSHGSPIDENAAAEVSGLAYHAILDYLNRRFRLQTIERINGAPRTFQSFEWFGAFLRCASGSIPELPDLERNWQNIGKLIDQPTNY
jgi:hypothetical protein